jgi:hypothetical protein
MTITGSNRRITRSICSVIAAASVVAAGGGAFVALCAGPASARRALPAGAPTTSSSTMLTTLQQHYSLLKDNSATSETPIPVSIQARPVFQDAETRLGLDVSLARMASGPNGIRAWLVPGSSGFCTIVSTPARDDSWSTGCGVSVPASGFLGVAGDGPAGSLVGGFVPDGNPSVTLQNSASTTTVPVANNVFFEQSGTRYTEMTDSALDGATMTTSVGMPASTSAAVRIRHAHYLRHSRHA